MLTGDQIAAARKLAGIKTQADLAARSGVSEPAIARAEAAGSNFPGMQTTNMVKIVRALEAAGAEFALESGASLAGGVSIRVRGGSSKAWMTIK